MQMRKLSVMKVLLSTAAAVGILTSGSAAVADDTGGGVPWSYGGAFGAWTFGRGQGYMDQIHEEYARALAQPANAKTGQAAPWNYGGAFGAWTFGRGSGYMEQIHAEYAQALARPENAKSKEHRPWTYGGAFAAWTFGRGPHYMEQLQSQEKTSISSFRVKSQ